ncbi:MAG TPA: nucleotide exchange factor GrpE [Pseudonocardiaceae bacterium]|nr:nucleotide exchange factor GrpE [Pseudonocardiaceae bacterium]
MTGQIRVPPEGEHSGPTGGVQVDEATAGADTGATVEVGAEELDTLRSQLEERTGDLQRITAEYSNYRRRVERDRQLVIATAKAQVAGELLTVLDDIERAEAHGDLSGTFKVVADKLVAGLAAQGLESFGGTGDEFDPDVHEAVQHSTSPDVQGPTVTAVLRRGYRFGERVLRPAMVAVTDAEPVIPPLSETAAEPEEMSRDAARMRPDAASPGEYDGSPADSVRSAGSEPGQEQ